MPTKEIGPANAVTVADRILDSKINWTRNNFTLTPMLCAYTSPRRNASIGLDSKIVSTIQKTVTTVIVPTLSQLTPEKLPIDQLCRLTMLESSAKVTAKSVIAEQI